MVFSKKKTEIVELEKHLKVKLTKCKIDEILKIGSKNCYATNSKDQVIGINLRGNGIRKLHFLKNFPELKYVDVRTNNIEEIDILKELKKISVFWVNYNNIENVKLKGLEHITDIGLSHSNIQSLEIEDCPNLENIGLTTSRSHHLKNIFLKNLPSIKKLILSNLKLDSAHLQGLFNLEYVDLSRNFLTDLRFIRGLKKLKTLILTQNQISDIIPLRGLTSLKILRLSINKIPEISLHFLDCFVDLEELEIYRNPIHHLPREIFDRRGNSLKNIRDFLKDLNLGKSPNNNVKLILIGNGSVGKTQIAKRLSYQEQFIFDEEHDSTHGIIILKRHLDCEHMPQGLRLNIWDFAGQDIYHATHRLFMRTQALFVLVWDFENEKRDFHIHNNKQYKNEKLLYWLEYAKCFGESSPIILLQNKVDTDKHSKNRILSQTEKYYKDNFKISDSLQVSARTGKGFYLFEFCIPKVFEKYEHLKEALLIEIPTPWELIRESMIDLFKDGVKEIDFESFKAICAKNNVPDSAPSILQFLNDTGTIYFKEGYFNNHIIINQSWAIEAIYSILDRDSHYFEILEYNKGRIGYNDLKRVWKDNTDKERQLFIEFMLSCELCFEIYEKTTDKISTFHQREFVLPQMLPNEKPKEISFIQKERMVFYSQEIQFRFLPAVFIERFIVRGSRFATVANMWQTGILLEFKELIGIVEADLAAKKIKITTNDRSEKFSKIIIQELGKIKNEGKIKAQYKKEGFDALLSGEKFLHFGDDFSPFKTKTQKIKMEHKEYIEKLITLNNFSQAVLEMLNGTRENGQKELNSKLTLLSARLNSIEEEKLKNTIGNKFYSVERANIGNSLIEYLVEYLPSPNFKTEGIISKTQQVIESNNSSEIPQFFITEMRKQFEDEYKKIQRYEKLLSDMRDANLRMEYQEEIELCDENIGRIEKRYIRKIKRNQPSIPEDEIKKIIINMKESISERFNRLDTKFEEINFSIQEINQSLDNTENQINPIEKEQLEELLAEVKRLIDKSEFTNKDKITSDLNGELSTSAMLKLTIPIIPGILKYESELLKFTAKESVKSWKDLWKAFILNKKNENENENEA